MYTSTSVQFSSVQFSSEEFSLPSMSLPVCVNPKKYRTIYPTRWEVWATKWTPLPRLPQPQFHGTVKVENDQYIWDEGRWFYVVHIYVPSIIHGLNILSFDWSGVTMSSADFTHVIFMSSYIGSRVFRWKSYWFAHSKIIPSDTNNTLLFFVLVNSMHNRWDP
jgi:hypothetical protein